MLQQSKTLDIFLSFGSSFPSMSHHLKLGSLNVQLRVPKKPTHAEMFETNSALSERVEQVDVLFSTYP